MIDTSVIMPVITVQEEILSQVMVILCGIIGFQWLLTSQITKTVKAASYYFFGTAVLFSLASYFMPRAADFIQVFNQNNISLSSFRLISTDLLVFTAMVFIRLGKLRLYDVSKSFIEHIPFLIGFITIDLLLVVMQIQEVKYFILSYSIFMILICSHLLTDSLKFSSAGLAVKILDLIPFGAVLILMFTRIMSIAIGSTSNFLSETEIYVLWSYIFLIGFLNVNLTMHVMQYQMSKLIQATSRDGLTGAYLRSTIIEKLNTEFSRAQRHDKILSVIFLDIDFFKKINDTFGHAHGDNVLKHVTNTISSNIRKIDVLGRWGGEEFIIVLPKTNLEQAVVVAEKLKNILFETPIKIGHEEIKITASFGVSQNSEFDLVEPFNIDHMIDRADQAMYQAKQNGRNRVEWIK